jgi:hypothetical protein
MFINILNGFWDFYHGTKLGASLPKVGVFCLVVTHSGEANIKIELAPLTNVGWVLGGDGGLIT